MHRSNPQFALPAHFLFLLSLFGAFTAASPLKAAPARFDMRDAGLRNLVHFISDAPLEKIVGVSNGIDGWVELDPEKLDAGVKGEFTLDLRTFETGNAARNEQLREKFLSTSDYPIATFSIVRLLSASKPKLVEGQPTLVRLEGTLTLRGTKKPQRVVAKLTHRQASPKTRERSQGNLLRVSGSLDIDLNAFSVPIPEVFQERVSRYIQVEVDTVGSDKPPAGNR